jgi:hypothetical protein
MNATRRQSGGALSLLGRMRASFDAHHDHTSVVRQRTIANLALAVEIAIAVSYFVSVEYGGWHLEIARAAGVVVIVLASLGFIGMAMASSLPRVMLKLPESLSDVPVYEDLGEPQLLMSARRYLYYPASYLTFVATGIFVEVTGGLVNSPFTSLFFAMVLGAQQLSRFKLNSRIFIAFGVLATALLAGYEAVFGITGEPRPPAALTFYILAFAFLVTALCTHATKPENFRARGRFPDPSHAELYFSSSEALWRFSLYSRGSRLDAILDGSGPAMSMEDAQRAVAHAMLEICRHGQTTVDWQESPNGGETVGYVRPAARKRRG